ncbi:hypothetical protein DFH27DRAFT_468020, partial [Peziza echinospora]
GLFVFDLIILVVENHFSQQDLIILEHWERYNIPSVILRSRANQHILNSIHQQHRWEDDDRDFHEVYEPARKTLIAHTQVTMRENQRSRGLDPVKPVYIISCDAVASLLR